MVSEKTFFSKLPQMIKVESSQKTIEGKKGRWCFTGLKLKEKTAESQDTLHTQGFSYSIPTTNSSSNDGKGVVEEESYGNRSNQNPVYPVYGVTSKPGLTSSSNELEPSQGIQDGQELRRFVSLALGLNDQYPDGFEDKILEAEALKYGFKKDYIQKATEWLLDQNKFFMPAPGRLIRV
jgi:hypothetical protein